MTEDDTFDTLRRVHISEMIQHVMNFLCSPHYVELVHGLNTLNDLCIKYGWTWNDFKTAGAIWLDRQQFDI